MFSLKYWKKILRKTSRNLTIAEGCRSQKILSHTDRKGRAPWGSADTLHIWAISSPQLISNAGQNEPFRQLPQDGNQTHPFLSRQWLLRCQQDLLTQTEVIARLVSYWLHLLSSHSVVLWFIHNRRQSLELPVVDYPSCHNPPTAPTPSSCSPTGVPPAFIASSCGDLFLFISDYES